MFKPVTPQVDFVALEKELLKHWYEDGIVDKYLHKNDQSKKKFNFLDGPITANNPMGVHHAWGRTYKDLWQKYYTMRGYAQRYRNGFDCQGLWVEVEVEKELGFKSKKDIENYGIANFVNKCKERVLKYSAIQTEQTKRLGNFMDWNNSYFTMSDENNYHIWNFLKVCWERGWLYKGHESIPWCPRCETAISQHEILTEDYKEVTHESVYLKLPLIDHPRESLLVWTTTPWTIPANIAVAVDSTLQYSLVDGLWTLGPQKGATKTVLGSKLVGLKYRAPYDYLEAVQKVSSHKLFHTVIATDTKIMPISSEEGTGLVHTAVSAGEEDFKLGKKLGLPMIPVIGDNADYLPGLGDLSGQNAKKHPEIILDYLKSEGWAHKIERYTHRYPACWRCKAELVWKVADEWYIAMDKPDDSGKTLRKQMMAVAKKIKWLPEFGLDRELDWLKNMHDWLISKKNRYWGLALPIYECSKCDHFEVIGSKDEFKYRAVSGWDKFADNSPHRPWVDEVKISCSKCGQTVSRILDVGNPWLDAGIVPFSTMPADWFPADFITESFPGQFKNWFYAMIAMSTVLAKTNPFRTVLGYASLFDEKGQIMHKSAGNMVEFNEGADKIGADVMRWAFVTHQPYDNLLFGYKTSDETRRRFHLILWNVYNFYITYANLYPTKGPNKSALDHWILARLNQTISQVSKSLDAYDPFTSSQSLEELLSDISLWYVRRSRGRPDCLPILHTVLVTFVQLLAPFNPYISEEIYRNLTGEESVHLSDWPKASQLSKEDIQLIADMELVRKTVEMGLSQRKSASVKVRQPLHQMTITGASLNTDLTQLIKDELNIKEVVWKKGNELTVSLDLNLDLELIAEGQMREISRQVQDLRKLHKARLDQHINIVLPQKLPDHLLDRLKAQTLANQIKEGDELQIELL